VHLARRNAPPFGCNLAHLVSTSLLWPCLPVLMRPHTVRFQKRTGKRVLQAVNCQPSLGVEGAVAAWLPARNTRRAERPVSSHPSWATLLQALSTRHRIAATAWRAFDELGSKPRRELRAGLGEGSLRATKTTRRLPSPEKQGRKVCANN